MTERDRAAVRVQLLAERIDPELPRHRQHLGRERLVQLDDVHVLDRHPRPSQHSPDGLDRPDAHDLRLDAGHGRGDDSRPRTDPELARPLLAHHDDRGRSVVQRARVARRHPAVGLERRLERRQSLQRRLPPRPVVLRDAVPGRHLAVEEARVLGRHGALLRALCVLVHVLARDVPSLSDVLRRQFAIGASSPNSFWWSSSSDFG